MKKSILFCLVATLTICCQSIAQKKLRLGDHELFKVSKATSAITVDGKMDEVDWQKTESRTFEHFYRIEKADDQQKTTFRMLWDDKNLYAFFKCEDKYITARETERDGKPYFDDCAEVFLIPAPDSLDMHFCFELNLYKAANDLLFFNNFRNGKNGVVKAYNPDFEVEVTIDGTVNDNSDIDRGWTMEFALPLSIFSNLETFYPVKAGTQWAFLAIRQERNDATGNRRSTSTLFPIYDISKSVHQPEHFGLLEFVE